MRTNFLRLLFGLVTASFIGHTARAESFTTNIIDGFGTNVGGYFKLGQSGPFNFLLITNGGALTNTFGIVGEETNAHNNLAIVTGAGSFWRNSDFLYVGQKGGSNEVWVLDGAQLSIANAIYVSGWYSSTDNRLLVAGLNSLVSCNTLLPGMYTMRDEVIVEQGGRINAGNITFGSEGAPEGNNLLWVRGAGSLTLVTNNLNIHGHPHNRVLVTDGGRMETRAANFGDSFFTYGNYVEVSGAGSLWLNRDKIALGVGSSSNVLAINDGAHLRLQTLVMGDSGHGNRVLLSRGGVIDSGSFGALTTVTNGGPKGDNNVIWLQDSGTLWSNAGPVMVGVGGSGNRLVVTNGATFLTQSASGGTLAVNGSGNEIAVAGTGSYLGVASDISIGMSGPSNRMAVYKGAAVSSRSMLVGINSTARSNLLFVTDPGTTLSTLRLTAGVAGSSNQITIANGATVNAQTAATGDQGGGFNRIVLEGAGTLLRATNSLHIRDNTGRGELFILDGARAESGSAMVGFAVGGKTAQINGLGSTWSNITFTLGDSSTSNALNILSGGQVQSRDAAIGFFDQADFNRVLLAGEGSRWAISSNLSIGVFGNSNSFSILSGAKASALNVYVGASAQTYPPAAFASDGNILVLVGDESSLTITSNLWIGVRGMSNLVSIRDGAQLASHDLIVGASSATKSRMIVAGDGSAVRVDGVLSVGSSGPANEFVIAQGGSVSNAVGYVGASGMLIGEGSSCVTLYGGNRALVTGSGSLWRNSSQLVIGQSQFNYLTISNDAAVAAGSITVGNSNGLVSGTCGPEADLNVVTIAGGCLFATNAGASGITLLVRYGTLRQLSGLTEADRVYLANGFSRIEILGGTLRTPSISCSGGRLLIGDGVHDARWELTGGGSDLPCGLFTSQHSQILGRGEVAASFTNFGIIGNISGQPSDLHLAAPVTLSAGSKLDFVIAGNVRGESYGSVRFGGRANFNGKLRLALGQGFVPNPSDVFNIVQFNSSSNAFLNAPDGARLKTVDNLGSFLVTYGPTNIVLSGYQSTDLDGDRIEDAWAQNYFGHSPLTGAEKSADADGDAASNYDEFLAGTDPQDAASVFKVMASYAEGATTLEFACVDGKTYRVWFSDDLEQWREVSDPTFAHPSADRCAWMDDGKDTGGLGGGMKFFRVSVE